MSILGFLLSVVYISSSRRLHLLGWVVSSVFSPSDATLPEASGLKGGPGGACKVAVIKAGLPELTLPWKCGPASGLEAFLANDTNYLPMF